MFAVDVKELTKRYKDKTAVDGISLQIPEGELFSLLGVNGAGKTTTVKVLCCLTDADSGEALVMGKSCSREKAEVKRVTGISPQETSVAEKLTVRENLQLMAEISGFDKEKCALRVSETLSQLGLDEAADQRTEGAVSGRAHGGAGCSCKTGAVACHRGAEGQGDYHPDHSLYGGGRAAFRPHSSNGIG